MVQNIFLEILEIFPTFPEKFLTRMCVPAMLACRVPRLAFTFNWFQSRSVLSGSAWVVSGRPQTQVAGCCSRSPFSSVATAGRCNF